MKLIAAILFTALLAVAPAPADAADGQSATLKIENPSARATPAGAKVAGAYMTIRNTGSEPDRLLGGTSPAAERVEVHEMKMDEGVMRMRPVAGGLEIPAAGQVELKPGGLHIMMTGLSAPLKEGDQFPISLSFERAGTVDVIVDVKAIGAEIMMKGGHSGSGN